jgi:hypothetical protein
LVLMLGFAAGTAHAQVYVGQPPPGYGQPQVVVPQPQQGYVQPGWVPPAQMAPGYTPEERARLEARTGEELRAWPLPPDLMQLEMELQLVTDQRNSIDIGGITALQWIGASFMIIGGAAAAIILLGGVLVAAFSSGGLDGGFWGAVGGSAGAGVVIGLPMVLLAELDGNLHRRRELDYRIDVLRRLQRQQRRLQPALYVGENGGGFTLSGTF